VAQQLELALLIRADATPVVQASATAKSALASVAPAATAAGAAAERAQASAAAAANVAQQSYDALRASLDPAVAAQQRYERAVAVVRQAQAAAGTESAHYADTLAQIEARLSPAALAQQQLAAEQAAAARAAQVETQQLAALMDALGLTDRAAREYDQALALLKSGHADGRVSADQYGVAVERLHERLLQARASQSGVASAATAGGGAIQLQAHQWANLSYQLQDVAVQLAGGQNPLLIAIQQGPQATSAVGGVSNALRLLGGALTGPVALVAAVAVALGALAAAGVQATERMRALAQAQVLSPQPLGLTTAALAAQASAWADAGGISGTAAQQIAQAGVRAGLSADALATITLAARDLAQATGQDAVEAASDLADMLRHPSEAADELNKNFNLLTASETAHVRQLDAQGRSTEAAAYLAERYTDRLSGLADRGLGPLSHAWDLVAASASDAWGAVGRFVAGSLGYGDVSQTEWLERRASALSELAALEAAQQVVPQLGYETDRVRLQALLDLIDAKLDAPRRAVAESDEARLRAAGRAAADLALSLDVGAQRAAELDNQIAKLSVPNLTTDMDPSAELQYWDALDRLNNARDTWISDSDRAVAAAQIEQKAVKKTGIERELYVARAQAELAARGQLLTSTERANLLVAAETQVQARAAQARADAVESINDEIAAQKALADVAGQGAAARRAAERDGRVAQATRTGGAETGAAVATAEDAREAAEVKRIRAEQTADINQQTAAEARRIKALLDGAAATRTAEQAEQARKLALAEAKEGTAAYTDAYQRYVDLLAAGDRTADTEALINLTNQSAFAAGKLADQLTELERQRPLAQLLDASGKLPGALAAVDDQIHQNRLALREAEAAGQGFAGGVRLAAVRLERDLGTSAAQGARVAGAAYGALEDQLVNLALKGKFSFRSLVDSIKVEMVRLAAQKFVINIATSTAGAAVSGFLGTLGGKILGAFGGGFFADGGRPPVGKVSVVGERGAELWVPDQPGTIIPNHDIADWLAAQGRNGDSLVAHISMAEAALLRRIGGAGTINPATGLPEYYDGDTNDRGIGEGGGPSGSKASSDRNDGGDQDRATSSAGAGRGDFGYKNSGGTFGYDPDTAPGNYAIETITASLERKSFVDAVLESLTPIDVTKTYDPKTGGVNTSYDFNVGSAVGGLVGGIFGGPVGGLIGGKIGSGVGVSVPLGSTSGVAGARIGGSGVVTTDTARESADALDAIVTTLAADAGVAVEEVQKQIDLLAKWALQIGELNPRLSEADKIAADARRSMADLKSSIDDVVKAATDADGADMGDAAKKQAVAMVALAAATSAVQEPLSDLQRQIVSAQAEAAEYALLLKELGADSAAAQAGLDATMSDLKATFEDDLKQALMTPAQREFEELRRQQAARLVDAKAVGADLALADQASAAERKAFLDDLTDAQRAAFLGLTDLADGLLTSIDALRDAASTAADGQLTLARDAAQAARQAADAYLDAAGRLADSLADARTGRLSPFSRQQQLSEAQQRFDVAAGSAQAGDVAAAQALPALRETLLSAAQAVYGSTTEYARIFAQSETSAAQALAASAGLGAAGTADADVRDEMVSVLEAMQQELRGEADAGALQTQLDALAALDGRLAALHDITLVQTAALATGLASTQAATVSVATALAAGIGVVSAPTIAADLAQVQAALVGNNSAEANAVRSAISALTAATADGLIDAAEAEPTRTAIAAMQAGLAAVINTQAGSLAGSLGSVNATTGSLLAAINAGTGAAAVNATAVTSTLTQVQAALAGNNSAEANAVRSAIAVLTATTADGLIDAAEAEPTRAAIAAMQAGLAAVINTQTGSLAGSLGLVNATTGSLLAAINAGTGAAAVNATAVTSTLTQVQAALAGNNSAEANAVRSAIAVLTATTADGLIDAAEAEPTRTAIAAMQANLSALAGATTVAVSQTTGQVVRLADLTAAQISAILSGDTTAANLLDSVTGAVVTQTGEVKAGNTVQSALTGLTATNNELIRQLAGGNSALVTAQGITTDTIRAGNSALTGAIGALLNYQASTAQADLLQQQLAAAIADRQAVEAERQALQPALSGASAAVQQQALALAAIQQRDAQIAVAATPLAKTVGVSGTNWTTYNTSTGQIDGWRGQQSEPDADVTRAALRALDYARSLGLSDIAGRVVIGGHDAGNTAQVAINGQAGSFGETDASGLVKWVVENLNAAVGGISAETLAAVNWSQTSASMSATLASLQGQLATSSAADATLASQIAAATASEQALRQQIAQLLSVPGYASGTASSAGGLAWLAEDGPEVVAQKGLYMLRPGSQVLTASQTRTLAARGPSFAAAGGGVDLSPLLAELAALRRDNAEARALLSRSVQAAERQLDGTAAVVSSTRGVAAAINRRPLTAPSARVSYGGRRG
jgi:hypothetical protein